MGGRAGPGAVRVGVALTHGVRSAEATTTRGTGDGREDGEGTRPDDR